MDNQAELQAIEVTTQPVLWRLEEGQMRSAGSINGLKGQVKETDTEADTRYGLRTGQASLYGAKLDSSYCCIENIRCKKSACRGANHSCMSSSWQVQACWSTSSSQMQPKNGTIHNTLCHGPMTLCLKAVRSECPNPRRTLKGQKLAVLPFQGGQLILQFLCFCLCLCKLNSF